MADLISLLPRGDLMMADIGRVGWQIIFRTRKSTRRTVERFAADCHNATILELGSGPPDGDRYPYSVADLFDASCIVVRSDVDPSFGHRVIDCTKMEYDAEWDAIVATNVLEHIYDAEAAVRNIRRALKPGGRALVTVPFAFPLHNEPIDFWRFTEHSLRHLFRSFSEVDVSHRGWRRAPLQYEIVAYR
jgi:SAM-dependent methyltransferase